MSDGINDGHEYAKGRSLTGDNRRAESAPDSAHPITQDSQSEIIGLRKRIHFLEGHNQFFERCESAWCHPSSDNFPALEAAKGTLGAMPHTAVPNYERIARLEQELARYRAPRVKKPVVYESEGDDIMDPQCIPICDALNLLPGIETISSCCGHGYAPFRIYFIAWTLDHLKPILELIDESEIWTLRTSMATGDTEIYFVLDGKKLAYEEANQLAVLIAERSVKIEGSGVEAPDKPTR